AGLFKAVKALKELQALTAQSLKGNGVSLRGSRCPKPCALSAQCHAMQLIGVGLTAPAWCPVSDLQSSWAVA
ncbi:unnamed protein product, partial [Effrenium voratum]